MNALSLEPPDDLRTATQRAGEQFYANLDELVRDITDRVWRAVPEYSEILVEQADLEKYVRPNITDAVLYMIDGREFDQGDLLRLDDLGRSRALQGLPLSALIQSFRIGERALVDAFCVFCIRAAYNSAQQRLGIQLISAILDKVETATVHAYRKTQQQRILDEDVTVGVLVARMVDGSPADREAIDAQARLIGADPALPYQCVAFSVIPEHSSAGLTHLRRHVRVRLIEAGVYPRIAGICGDTVILLLPAPDHRALSLLDRALARRQYRFPVVAAAGEVYDSLFDARASCGQALAAIDAARRLGEVNRVIGYGAVALEVILLSNKEASRRLVTDRLGPLHNQPLLLETIRDYIDLSRSAQATAAKHNVHVNTIAYRLGRVKKLTGYDIHELTDAIELSLALRAQDLLDGPGACVVPPRKASA